MVSQIVIPLYILIATNMVNMKNKSLIPTESLIKKILVIRNQKVILDRELAFLYDVETRVLKQAVQRNRKRFPSVSCLY